MPGDLATGLRLPQHLGMIESNHFPGATLS